METETASFDALAVGHDEHSDSRSSMGCGPCSMLTDMLRRLLETLQSPYKKANSTETALIAVLTLSLSLVEFF